MTMASWRTGYLDELRTRRPAGLVDVVEALPLRPAIRLTPAAPGDAIVGRLGGPAPMPAGAVWPHEPGGLPLTFVALLDCAALATYGGDLPLPADGALLFFLPSLENLGVLDRGYTPPVIHVPAGAPTVELRVPAEYLGKAYDTYEYPPVPLTGRTIATVPGSYSPFLGTDLDEIRRISELLNESDLPGAVHRPGPDHQVGGHSVAFQRPLEASAAKAAGVEGWFDDPGFLTAIREYVLLLQIDEDTAAGMVWGDGALAMWAMHRADLEAGDFTRVHVEIEGH
jgi:hypothetical protein